MNKKLLTGLVVLAIAAVFPLTSLSNTESPETQSIVLSKDNLIVLRGEVNGESASNVIAKAKDLDTKLSGLSEKYSGKKHLYIFLNTPGGGVQAGLEMTEALKGLGRPIDTVTLFAASMGFQIVQSLDERLILKSGVLMSHHAVGEFEGEFGGSVKTQMENRAQLWLDRVRELDEQTVKRTKGKQTYESYTKEYDHEVWLTGTKSVQEGYADRTVTVKCDKSLNGVQTMTVSFMGVELAYDLDNCPLNTSPMNVRLAKPAEPDEKNYIDPLIRNMIIENFKKDFLSRQKQAIPMYW